MAVSGVDGVVVVLVLSGCGELPPSMLGGSVVRPSGVGVVGFLSPGSGVELFPSPTLGSVVVSKGGAGPGSVVSLPGSSGPFGEVPSGCPVAGGSVVGPSVEVVDGVVIVVIVLSEVPGSVGVLPSMLLGGRVVVVGNFSVVSGSFGELLLLPPSVLGGKVVAMSPGVGAVVVVVGFSLSGSLSGSTSFGSLVLETEGFPGVVVVVSTEGGRVDGLSVVVVEEPPSGGSVVVSGTSVGGGSSVEEKNGGASVVVTTSFSFSFGASSLAHFAGNAPPPSTPGNVKLAVMLKRVSIAIIPSSFFCALTSSISSRPERRRRRRKLGDQLRVKFPGD